jgi:uncharacterized protein YjbI with pentapeptide repeats
VSNFCGVPVLLTHQQPMTKPMISTHSPRFSSGMPPEAQQLWETFRHTGQQALSQTADVFNRVRNATGNLQEGAKWATPLTTLYLFFNQEKVTNGLDRVLARKKFDRRTTQTLKGEDTSDNDRLKMLHWRDRWGLNALPKDNPSIPERESESRFAEEGDPTPVAYEKYNPEKPSLIAGKDVTGLKIPIPIALPNVWRGKASQWRIPLDASGTPNSKLNHDYAVMADGKLKASNFSNSTLRHVDASNTNMTGTDLTDSELLKTGLFKTLLAGAKFIRTKGIPSSDPQFWDDNLKKSQFEGDSAQSPMALTFQNFAKKQLDGARLKWVDWFKSSLKGGSLAKAKLEEGVRILGMNMIEANLQQLKAPEQNWAGVNVEKSNMAGLQSPGSNFSAIENLLTANMDSSQKHPGDYSRSNLRGQNLEKKKLRHNNFTNTIFSPTGESLTPDGKAYQYRELPITDYLKPIMLSPAEARLSEAKLIAAIKRPINPIGKKLISLAYMEKPIETKASLAANNDDAYRDVIAMARKKQKHYEIVAKAKQREQKQLLKQWQKQQTVNLKKHAKTSETDFSFSNMSGSNLQGNNLTQSQFVGSNLKDTLLADANVTDTNFTRAKNLTLEQLSSTHNANNLVYKPQHLNSLVYKIQQKQRVSKKDINKVFPSQYLSPEHRSPLLARLAIKPLIDKALLEKMPNAYFKTLFNKERQP